VRELVRDRPGQPFRDVVNDAVLQTIPRTVNTGLGAMFILAALAVLGGDSLQGFALALLAGLVVGTWSSVFTASPLLILLERRFPQEGTVRGMTAPARDAVPAVAATTREPGQRAPAGRARPGRRYDPADPYAFVDEAAPVSRRSD
jgi:hypothetical protein